MGTYLFKYLALCFVCQRADCSGPVYVPLCVVCLAGLSYNNAMAEQCIFCAIAADEAQADVVYENDETVFFHDIRPKMPVHIVGITRRHISSLATAMLADLPYVGALLAAVPAAAREAGLAAHGFRVVSNAGGHAGQEVPHLHVHVLGGGRLGPMVCREA